MCRCTPEVRTPFCGKPGCEWPASNVVPLAKKERHLTGICRCINCTHEWVGVIPEGDDLNMWLECPSCGCHKGRMKGRMEVQAPHWHCNCGNDLFHVTPDWIYCPNCGREQEFP